MTSPQINLLFLVIFQPKFLNNIYFKKLTDISNYYIKMGKFPDVLKNVEVTPVYENNDVNDKQNYRPMSTLSNLSKVFTLKLIHI